jgi:uncharacterized membrane protein
MDEKDAAIIYTSLSVVFLGAVVPTFDGTPKVIFSVFGVVLVLLAVLRLSSVMGWRAKK